MTGVFSFVLLVEEEEERERDREGERQRERERRECPAHGDNNATMTTKTMACGLLCELKQRGLKLSCLFHDLFPQKRSHIKHMSE